MWKHNIADFPPQNCTSAHIYCVNIICNISAVCQNLCFGLFYATRCRSSISVAFYISAKWSRDLLWAAEPHLGRALAAPRSPGSLVLAELASLVGQIGLGDLVSWTLCRVHVPSIKLMPKPLLHWFRQCSSFDHTLSEGQLDQAWCTWWAVTSKRSWRASSSVWPRCWACSTGNQGSLHQVGPWNIGMRLDGIESWLLLDIFKGARESCLWLTMY